MFTTNARDTLLIAHERAHRLRQESAAMRLRPTTTRRAVAASLRRAADRLDPAPLSPRPA